ncbi:MAG: hypothetical protein ACYC6R_07595 [Anaerolineales bacterium]
MHKLTLRLANLVILSAQDSYRGSGVIILHKISLDACVKKTLLLVTFQKKTVLILKYSGKLLPCTPALRIASRSEADVAGCARERRRGRRLEHKTSNYLLS